MNRLPLPPDSTMERIRLHYTEKAELKEADKEILARWETAHALILDRTETDRNVSLILMERFNIGQCQAYLDIKNSKNFFGDVRASSREGMRYILSQWAIKMLKMAEATKNLRAAEKFMMILLKANNLDKEDQDIPDPAKIQPPVQLLNVNFNLINTPRFKMLDVSMQRAILQIYDQVMPQIINTPLGEYSDVYKIDDSQRPGKDE